MKIYEASLTYSLIKECPTTPLDQPQKVWKYMQDAFQSNPMQESFWVISLNRKNHPISRSMVFLGSMTNSIVNPPEIFRMAILNHASAIIVAHNHPSGDPSPSAADIKVTRTLRECGTLMNIQLIDHLICGDSKSDPQGLGYYSFNDAGLC